MKITKKNVSINGEWSDEHFTGSFYSGPELDGFWLESTFTAKSNDGYITHVSFEKWDSGYIDDENNACELSESMNDLMEKKVREYIKNAVL
jgi:hypothetical protein